MKTKVLLAALASMALASCTNNEQLLDETKKGREIRLEVASQTAQTRVEHDKDGAYVGNLLVWAWEAGTNTTIINGKLYNSGSNTFENNEIYYYPTNGNEVDFLLVPSELKTNGYFDAPNRTEVGMTEYKFSVGHGDNHSGSQHKTNLMTSEIITQQTGVVGVILRHLTTKLNVRIQQVQRQNDAVTTVATLKKVELRNIKNSGYVTLNNEWSAVNGGDDCMWTDVTNQICTWEVQNGSYALASHDMSAAVTNFEYTDEFYVLPQEFVDGGQQFYIEYTVESKYKSGNQPDVIENLSATIDLNDFSGVPYWAMNKHVTYIVSINPLTDSHKITFDVEEEAWGNMNGEITVGRN